LPRFLAFVDLGNGYLGWLVPFGCPFFRVK
jgi:hypothetical protein